MPQRQGLLLLNLDMQVKQGSRLKFCNVGNTVIITDENNSSLAKHKYNFIHRSVIEVHCRAISHLYYGNIRHVLFRKFMDRAKGKNQGQSPSEI